MSFNDLAKKEAAEKEALRKKETKSTTKTDEGPASVAKSADPKLD